ncbi:hypothetical protein ACJMK2_025275 [Sinanodonta woodiana]|uniref:C-type lectin domain-containing protein n=1 Tax=Sinanodonta woodiana TaxID=1069815 RepID=A0ABD3XHX6_SINWO
MCLEAHHIHNNGQSTAQSAEVLVGKRISIFGDCPACCYTDFCNNKCSQNNSVAIQGITQVPTIITITNTPVITINSTKQSSATIHHDLTKATKFVTDVHQHHTSMRIIAPTQTTKHQTLVTEVTHLGTHLHQEQTSTHVPSITHAAQECSQVGSGYIQTRHLCIKFHSDAKTFKDAATDCSKEGAMLVTIDTAYKMNEIWSQLQTFSKNNVQDLWIGGSDIHHNDTFYWQNGVEVRPYTNWGTHQQQTDNYTWYDEPCYRVYGFICEHPLQDVHTSTHQTTSCESQDGFHQLEHNLGCVMYVQTAMDWQSASNYCTKHHSHLVTINSQKKQDAIHRFATSHGTNDFPWIGFVTTVTSPHDIHHWRWESGIPYTYNNWAVKQPEGPGTCVVMATNGHWRNNICSSNHPLICQKW